MKKFNTLIALAFFTLVFPVKIYSQGIYFSLNGGYGTSLQPTLFSSSEYNSSHTHTWNGMNDIETQTRNCKIIKGTGSFGLGTQFGGALGYMFSKNLGAELGFGYVKGKKITNKYSYSDTYYDQVSGYTDIDAYQHEMEFSGSMLRLIPALRLTTGSGNFRPYMKIGMVMGVNAKLVATSRSSEQGSGTTDLYEQETIYTGGTSFGYNFGLGGDYKANKILSLFAELNLINQNWAPQKSKVTKAQDNGVDVLNSMSVGEKETTYSNSFTESSTGSYSDETVPGKDLKTYLPFGSFGMNIGLRITIPAKSKNIMK